MPDSGTQRESLPQIAKMEKNRLEPAFWGLNSTLNNYRYNSGGSGGIKWSTTHPPASKNWQWNSGRQECLRSSREREMCSSQLEKTPRADVTPNACLIAY